MTAIPVSDRIAAARGIPGSPDAAVFREYATLPELLAAGLEQRPDQEALVYLDSDGARSVWTYAELSVLVANVTGFLRAKGIVRGDRIATISANHSDTVIQYLAAWSVGAVVVPINVAEDDQRIAYILFNSGVELVFVQDSCLGRILSLKSRLPDLEWVISAGETQGSQTNFNEALRHAPIVGDAPEAIDPALIVYTSGTTGDPKGVVLTQSNLLVDAFQIAAWHGLSAGERVMCVLPIHHVNGTVVTLLTPLACGGTIVLCRKFRTSLFIPLLKTEEIVVVSVVPTLLSFLLEAADAGKIPSTRPDLPKFRHIICGAGPLTVELALSFQDRFGLKIVHGYGLSETTCYSCFLPIDLSDTVHRAWLGEHGFPSIGVAIPSNEMDIHDPEGRPVPPGERGEIVIRGHNVMAGYFNDDQANIAAFTHGWFRSGDEGFRLSDGAGRDYFFITGRLKELIIRGGVNISPLEIDEVLMGLEGVKAGVAVGFEHTVYGEEIGAYVVLQPGIKVQARLILAACGRVLPHHKCPKVVVFGTELPITSTGKYQRNMLKPFFTEWRETVFRKEDSRSI